MMVVPGLTPVTTPLLFTVATPVLDEVHGVAPGVPDPVKVIVADLQTLVGPVMVGCALTVIVTVFEQPLLLV
jgi:hypothetical protein